MPAPPRMKYLGTTSTLAEELKAGSKDRVSNFQIIWNEEREKKMSEGKGTGHRARILALCLILI